ncbi:uncharacterized protein LOC103957016 [Pyrus x bretschneideri]|uniref:uncharacterized protein LOC103957016 n=1 Tax=Pyrus x bretschneideri TaxID=225117 RepID=UPI00202E3039|nr:uncharacterized protein LOC103957016 [Pyrus x bretschneideri]
MGSKALNPKAQPFFLNGFQTPYLPARPVCAYRFVHQPRSFFCQLNLVQPNPTTQRVPRKSLKNKRNFAPPRSRNPLKKLEDENHAVGAPRVLAWVPKKDLPAGKRYTASCRQMKKDTVRGCDDGGGSGVVIPFPASPDLENISGPTTIMIKNIPNQFQRCDLLTVLRNHCRDENLQACTKVLPRNLSSTLFIFQWILCNFGTTRGLPIWAMRLLISPVLLLQRDFIRSFTMNNGRSAATRKHVKSLALRFRGLKH